MKDFTTIFLLGIIISFLIPSCAKVVAPTGGEKDESPPAIISSEPENYATNFTENKVIIKFDEYIQLQNVTQELLITPVQEENPEVKLRGKNLFIQLQDTLLENTTYNLNFYDAIKDVNEGNVLKNYQYVFSTGNEIDTLFIVGHVYNAFNLEYAEDVLVMLYKQHADSVPLTQKPFYITRTDETGAFSMNSIAPGSYKLFALKDANRNMLFDQPGEPIAFVDSLIKPKVKLEEVFDTIQVFNETDSTFYDSIFSKIIVVPAINELHLMLFTEDFENQYIDETKREKQKKVFIQFNRQLEDSATFEPLNFFAEQDWYVYDANENHDQVSLWLKDSSIYKKDSVYLAINYLARDSLDNWIPATDTVNFLFVEKKVEEKSRRERRKEEEQKDTIKVKIPSELKISFSAINYSEYDINKDVSLRVSYPVRQIDLNRITVLKLEDTTLVPQDFELVRDSVDILKYFFKTELITEYDYKIIADSGAFIDIYNNINDSTGVSFRIKKTEKYGTIFLSLAEYETPGILEIMNEKEEILRTMNIRAVDSVIEIKYLLPNKYRLKYICDRNDNGEWDTGDYEEKRQPEPVYYYPREIEIKENWDYDISWNLIKD